MNRVTLPDEICRQLHKSRSPIELCDSTGRVVGMFNPTFDPSEWEIVGRELTAEEIQQRLQSNQRRYTTAEVLAHLRSLENK